MARPRKYNDERINTSIRLSEGQKDLIYKSFDTIQSFIEDSFDKLEKRYSKKKKPGRLSGRNKKKSS